MQKTCPMSRYGNVTLTEYLQSTAEKDRHSSLGIALTSNAPLGMNPLLTSHLEIS